MGLVNGCVKNVLTGGHEGHSLMIVEHWISLESWQMAIDRPTQKVYRKYRRYVKDLPLQPARVSLGCTTSSRGLMDDGQADRMWGRAKRQRRALHLVYQRSLKRKTASHGVMALQLASS